MSSAFAIADCLDGVCAVGFGWEVGLWSEVGDAIVAILAVYIPANVAFTTWLTAKVLWDRHKRNKAPRALDLPSYVLCSCFLAIPMSACFYTACIYKWLRRKAEHHLRS